MDSAFVDVKELVRKIVAKAGMTNGLKVESWLQKHVGCKPGAELLHDQYSQIMTARCHGCQETVNFNFKVGPLN